MSLFYRSRSKSGTNLSLQKELYTLKRRQERLNESQLFHRKTNRTKEIYVNSDLVSMIP